MRADEIADAVRRGVGVGAQAVGLPHELHRPRGGQSPVRSGTARMRLPAHFIAQHAMAPSRGHPMFEGIFDSGYTLVGDYLVGAAATYFIASQLPMQPVACFRATRATSFLRAAGHAGVGLGAYGGMVAATAQPLQTGWPASVIDAGDGLDRAGVPADVTVGGWSVHLPNTLPATIRPGDLMTDDLGRAGVVAAAELSEFGWKLLVRQAAT